MHNKKRERKNERKPHNKVELTKRDKICNNMTDNYDDDFNIIAVYERQGYPFKLRRSKRLLENRKENNPIVNDKRTNNVIFTQINKRTKKVLRRSEVEDKCDDGENLCMQFDALTNKLYKTLKVSNLKNSEEYLVKSVREEIDIINNIVLKGDYKANIVNMSAHSNKRKMEVEYEDIVKPMQLIPQSQWVYNTPDKQKIKKIVAKDTSKPQILPAVYHTNKKMKVLYNLKDELVGKINVDKFSTGEQVQIDKRFLQPICEVTIGDSANNQFLSNDGEHTIEIKDINFTLSTSNETSKDVSMNYVCNNNSPYNTENMMDFEHDVYQVCTQRPAKSSKKLIRLNSFERRTLSFDETPKRSPVMPKHKSDSFLNNLSLTNTYQECRVVNEQVTATSCYGEKIAFQDRSNLIDIDRPSTSKGIYRNNNNNRNDIENMCLVQENCSNTNNNDYDFFSDDLWPDMPDMSSPKPLPMYPRKV